jgi:hypothetical protein
VHPHQHLATPRLWIGHRRQLQFVNSKRRNAPHFHAPNDAQAHAQDAVLLEERNPHLHCAYHTSMARGWESKSVEEQVEQRSSEHSPHAKLTQDAADAAKATRTLERHALELQRERILDERTSSPIRRKALEAALNDIEAKLSAL